MSKKIYELVIHIDDESLDRLKGWVEFADLEDTDIFEFHNIEDITEYYKEKGLV